MQSLQASRGSSALLKLVVLLPLLMGTTVSATPSTAASRSSCIMSHAAELAGAAGCGHKATLQWCLAEPAEYGWASRAQAADLEICFLDAGCALEAARTEAVWAVGRCNGDFDHGGGGLELRSSSSSSSSGGGRQLRARQDPPKTTPPPTLVPELHLLKCYSTATRRVPQCTTATAADGRRKEPTCSEVDQAYYRCIDGMRCKADQDGLPGCFTLSSGVGLAGVIVGAAFGVVIVLATVTICTCCMRDRAADKRLRKAADVAALQREAVAARQKKSLLAHDAHDDGDHHHQQQQQPQYRQNSSQQQYQPVNEDQHYSDARTNPFDHNDGHP